MGEMIKFVSRHVTSTTSEYKARLVDSSPAGLRVLCDSCGQLDASEASLLKLVIAGLTRTAMTCRRFTVCCDI